jgi:hypothetical protein
MCQGVDVAKLIAQAEAALACIQQLGPDCTAGFDAQLIPTIDLAPSSTGREKEA